MADTHPTPLIELTPAELASEYPALTVYPDALSATGDGRTLSLTRGWTAWWACRAEHAKGRGAGLRVDTREQLEGHLAWVAGESS